MCGSLLSKFRKKKNIVYPGITIFPEPGKNLKDAISSQCEANAVRALDSAKPVLPAINSINEAPPFAARNSDHLMDSAREILAIYGYAGSLQVATLGG